MKYQVQDPQGQTHIIEGPDNASQADIISQAQQLIPQQTQQNQPSQASFVDQMFSGGGQPMGDFSGLKKNLLTNEPVGFAGNMVRSIPSFLGSSLGAAVGGAAGVPLGPAGMAAGAAQGSVVGAGMGEALRQAAVGTNAAFGGTQAPTVLEAAGYPALAAGTQKLANIAAPYIAAGVRKITGSLPGLGAQAMRASAAVPEKYGQAALSDLSNLSKALPQDVVGQSYKAFENYTGLKGLQDLMLENGKGFSAGELESNVLQTMKALKAGEEVGQQQLYTAIQAANNLRQMAKFGEPTAKNAMEAGLVAKAKDLAESELAKSLPEYKSLATDYFRSKMANQFSSFFSLNANQSANQLRGYGSLATAAIGLATGHPIAVLAPFVQSPMIQGAFIRAAGAVAPVGQVAAEGGRAAIPLATQALSKMSAESIANYYKSP